jgi:hypothetical protein
MSETTMIWAIIFFVWGADGQPDMNHLRIPNPLKFYSSDTECKHALTSGWKTRSIPGFSESDLASLPLPVKDGGYTCVNLKVTGFGEPAPRRAPQ